MELKGGPKHPDLWKGWPFWEGEAAGFSNVSGPRIQGKGGGKKKGGKGSGLTKKASGQRLGGYGKTQGNNLRNTVDCKLKKERKSLLKTQQKKGSYGRDLGEVKFGQVHLVSEEKTETGIDQRGARVVNQGEY